MSSCSGPNGEVLRERAIRDDERQEDMPFAAKGDA